MASGDSLLTFTPLDNRPPASNFATLDTRGDFVILDFDDAIDEAGQFYAIVPSHYSGGNLVAAVTWTSSSAITGNALLRVEATRLASGANLDVPPAVGDSESITMAAPATNGNLVVSETAPLTVSSLAAGDILLVVLTRLATDVSDTLIGDVELFTVEIREE